MKSIAKKCICGKDFHVYPSRIKNVNYCSRNCFKLKRDSSSIKIKLICKECRKDFYAYPSYLKIRGQSYCSKRCKGVVQSREQSGANSAWWMGGKSSEHHRIRQSAKFKQWRKNVFERDNYTCRECGIRGGYLEPHHIKPFAYYPDLRFEVNNGKTLCKDCHKLTDSWGNKAKKLYGAGVEN